MGSAQYKFAAYPFEGSLFGDVMQHHHGTQDMALGMADRGQAVGQQSRLAIDFDTQVFRCPLQRAPAQHQLQLLIELGALQRRAQPLTQTIGLPAQLTLGHRVKVFQMALAVDHQQSVVNAVEHGLQALLAGQQLIDVGGLMFAQRLGHDPEAPGQLVQFHRRRNRQGDIEIALADIVRRLGQGLDGLPETSGNGLRGHEADDQHCQPHQAKQPGNQQCLLPGLALGTADVIQRALVLGDQTVA
ncbi:hypothetical protein D3C76_1073590 [compost metagenome]